MYHNAFNNDLDSLYLCLDEFVCFTVSMVTDLFQLTCFHTALKQCQKVSESAYFVTECPQYCLTGAVVLS